MMRIAVRFAYMGAGFSGSQIQPDTETVEGEMRNVIGKVCNPDPDVLDLRIASRTDKGVNALGNVAVFNTDFSDPHSLLKALNALSTGIFYNGFCVVDDEFNPRHASSREYRYILDSDGLNLDLARQCASLFVGTHDFIRFCKPDGKPTVTTIDSIDIEDSGDSFILTYRARYFLWNMVRRTAAAIASVSSGRSSLSEVESALNGQPINFGIARADALTLTDVQYEGLTFEQHSDPAMKSRLREMEFSNDLRSTFCRSLR